jgi:hypothetical protein
MMDSFYTAPAPVRLGSCGIRPAPRLRVLALKDADRAWASQRKSKGVSCCSHPPSMRSRPAALALAARPTSASSMGGSFAGVGVVYRFPKDERNAACGVEGRVALDVLLVQMGFRSILAGSSHSSEANLLFSVGVGRF